MTDPVILIGDLSRSFGRVQAVDHLSLAVPGGTGLDVLVRQGILAGIVQAVQEGRAMNVVLALMWKEVREQAPKLFIGIGVCLVLFLLRHLHRFDLALLAVLEWDAGPVGVLVALAAGDTAMEGRPLVLVFDIADPGRFHLLDRHLLETPAAVAFTGQGYWPENTTQRSGWSGLRQSRLAAEGNRLGASIYATDSADRMARLVLWILERDAAGHPKILGRLVVGGEDSAILLDPDKELPSLELADPAAYLALRGGVLRVDLSDPASPRESDLVADEPEATWPDARSGFLEEAGRKMVEYSYGTLRAMTRWRDRIYVESYAPWRLVELDASTPAAKVVDERYWQCSGRSILVAGDRLFTGSEFGAAPCVRMLVADRYEWRPVHQFRFAGELFGPVPPRRWFMGIPPRLAATDTHLCVALSDRVVAFVIPPR